MAEQDTAAAATQPTWPLPIRFRAAAAPTDSHRGPPKFEPEAELNLTQTVQGANCRMRIYTRLLWILVGFKRMHLLR